MELEKEKLLTLKEWDLIKYIENFVNDIFRGDDPLLYLQSAYPEIYNLYLAIHLDVEIGNGALGQFFWNTHNTRMSPTEENNYQAYLSALEAIGADKQKAVLEKAIARLNTNPQEKQNFFNHDLSDEISRQLRSDLRNITWNEYSDLDPNMLKIVEQYVAANADRIVK
jgi:hypothetical protein